MFVLPVIVFPLVLCVALYRLYQIPRRLLSGALQLPATDRRGLWLATVAAYLVLLGHTLMLITTFTQSILTAGADASAYLSFLGWVAAYPIVYIGSAWVFFYGLQKRPQ